MHATTLLLADGRFPAGGHAHSGGLEATVASGGVHDVASLEQFLRGRLWTTGVVNAAFAAAACRTFGVAAWQGLRPLDDELGARIPSPVLRGASRSLGRQLLRAARRVWPGSSIDVEPDGRDGLHHPVALGAVASCAGLPPGRAATLAAYDSVSGPATAAVRLLGLDPYAVHRSLAVLAPQVEQLAADVDAAHADTPARELPAWGAPLVDIATERHATAEVRLFAS